MRSGANLSNWRKNSSSQPLRGGSSITTVSWGLKSETLLKRSEAVAAMNVMPRFGMVVSVGPLLVVVVLDAECVSASKASGLLDLRSRSDAWGRALAGVLVEGGRFGEEHVACSNDGKRCAFGARFSCALRMLEGSMSIPMVRLKREPSVTLKRPDPQ